MKLTCLLLFCALAAVADAAPRRHSMEMMSTSPSLKASRPLSSQPPSFHTAKQDNFDDSNKNTWQQAYYLNSTFFDGHPSRPVFLCVGGEGPPLDGSVAVASPHCNVAVEWLQETKALFFAVEHRYYGCHNSSACPVASFGKDPAHALRFLSSRQALGDLATFHAYATQKYDLAPTNRWVTFGGSYPGMLASFARLKYPDLFYASVSSSAPVKAQLDMVGYFDVASKAYSVSDNGVGGSTACQRNIAAGHAKIGKLMADAAGRSQLQAVFGLSKDEAAALNTTQGKMNFAGYGVANFPSQANDPTCSEPACNIGRICTLMTASGCVADPVKCLAAVRKAQTGGGGGGSSSSSRSLKVDNEEEEQVQVGEPDYWGYQTCHEVSN